MAAPIYYIQARDRITGYYKPFDSGAIISKEGFSWEFQEQGGLTSIDVTLAVPFEYTGLSAGDWLEVWVTGETVPRCRAQIMIPEAKLADAEVLAIRAMGRMVHMNRVLLYQVFFDPAGANQDISILAGKLFSHYQKRIAQATVWLPPVTSLITPIGLNMQSLTMDPASCRSALDALYAQTAGNVVWGWNIDPESGYDQFYFVPRGTTVGHQFAVGADVLDMSDPEEIDNLINAAWVRGGAAKYPNLVTNPSFEQPQNPDADSGGILLNGGFEDPQTPTDSNPGYTDTRSDWTPSSSASWNWHDPATNHNFSPHTGRYCALLDGAVTIPDLTNPLDGSNSLYGTGDWMYQDVAFPDVGAGAPLGTPLIATLYAAQASQVSIAKGVLFLIGLDSSKNPTGEYFALPLGQNSGEPPQSIAWTGGAPTTVIGSDALLLASVFTDVSTAYVRFYLACTYKDPSATTSGLLIDDCSLAPAGAVGQFAWGTHLENPGSGANAIEALWACEPAAWEGAYGVRATVVANSSNRPVINPAGSTEFNAGTAGPYGFDGGANAVLLVGVRVRMTPGQNSAAGGCNVCYREFAGDGHETQSSFFPSGPSYAANVPNDGLWHIIYGTVTVHGDAVSAYVQLEFTQNGVYDIDGFTARSIASEEYLAIDGSDDTVNQQDPVSAGYLRGAVFEKYVTAESVCTTMSAADVAAAASVDNWGRLEGKLTNDNIVAWDADAAQSLQQFFQRAAVPLQRPSVRLVGKNALADSPQPADAATVAIVGSSKIIVPQWVSTAKYEIAAGSPLLTTLDLNNQRPTQAKLLLLAAEAATGGQSFASPSVGAPAGGGMTGTGGKGTGLLLQKDAFLVGSNPAGPYVLSQTPSGLYMQVIVDNNIEYDDNYTVTGNSVAWVGGYDTSQITNRVTIWYSYST